MGVFGRKACSWEDVVRYYPGTDPRIYALRKVHKIPIEFIRFYPPDKYRPSQAGHDLRESCRGGRGMTEITKFHKLFRGKDPRNYVFEKIYRFPRNLVSYMRDQMPWYTKDMAMEELDRREWCRRRGMRGCKPAYTISMNPSAKYTNKGGVAGKRYDAEKGGYRSDWNHRKMFMASDSMKRARSTRETPHARAAQARAAQARVEMGVPIPGSYVSRGTVAQVQARARAQAQAQATRSRSSGMRGAPTPAPSRATSRAPPAPIARSASSTRSWPSTATRGSSRVPTSPFAS